MAIINVTMNGEQKTHSFAQKMASLLTPGTVLGLTGDLGSGKTVFAQGFAKGMGVQDDVGSPTFKLVSEYEGANLNFYHIDCYRLKDEKDFLAIGGEFYLNPTDGFTLIEWSENIQKLLPKDCIKIHFERIENDKNKRILKIEGLDI